MSANLESLLAAAHPLELRGPRTASISSLEYDSRKVGPGSAFFAFKGIHSDGHRFIDAAISRGACVIVHDSELTEFDPRVTYIRYEDARLAMSPLAAAFHDFPSRSLVVIGVTGTEGKSTTVSLIYQLLREAGFKAGHISTVTSDWGQGEAPNPEHQTTPEATTIHKLLAQMRDAGIEYAVVESSSHGLSARTGRLADVEFDAAVFTNVTHEHLEFHGTWEVYRSDKANLFRALDRHLHEKKVGGRQRIVPSFGVVNMEDPSAPYFKSSTRSPVFGFSADGTKADFMAHDINSDSRGANFLLDGPRGATRHVEIELPGRFNVKNVLAALATVHHCTGLPWENLCPLLSRLRPVRGRMMRIDQGQPFEVIIDYAHTPSSFETVLAPLRSQVRERILCVFGSAGERDRIKRPEQGKIAAKYADILILTDEDPRGENPIDILEEIAAGTPGLTREESLFLRPDRPTAIEKAFELAKPGDMVLLLGKGHENSIIYADRAIPYDEEKQARKILASLGYSSEAT